MRAYSTDLREKIVLAYEGGEGTFDEIAETFGVARCTVGRLLKFPLRRWSRAEAARRRLPRLARRQAAGAAEGAGGATA